MKIYLASPLGFSEAGTYYKDAVLKPALTRLGYDVSDPWEPDDHGEMQAKINAVRTMPYGEAKRQAWRSLNDKIGDMNRDAITKCDLLLAVLDGVDVDSGTAAEIGYAFAKGKRILGYRGDFRLSADNEGSIVNLQVEYFIRHSGGDIITKIEDLARALDRLNAAGRKGPT